MTRMEPTKRQDETEEGTRNTEQEGDMRLPGVRESSNSVTVQTLRGAQCSWGEDVRAKLIMMQGEGRASLQGGKRGV